MTLDRFLPDESNRDAGGRSVARASALVFATPVCMSFIPKHFFIVCLPLGAFLWLLTCNARKEAKASSSSEIPAGV